jgi:hypothetical protein
MSEEPLQDDTIDEAGSTDTQEVDAQIAEGEQQITATDSIEDTPTEESESLTEEIDYRAQYEEMQSKFGELENRYKGARSAHDELAHKLKTFESTVGDIPLEDAIKTYKDRDRIVPAHDPSSPRHGRLNKALEQYKVYREQVSNADEQDREAIARAWQSVFSEQDVQDIKEWEAHQADFGRQLAMKPEETLAELVQKQVQEVLGRQSSQQQMEAEVKSIFEDDRKKSAIATYHDDWMKAMDQGKDPFLVADLLVARHEAEELRKKVGDVSVREESVKAQKELAKGKATQAKEMVASAKDADPYEVAKKRAQEQGFAPGDPRFNEILLETQRELLA